MISEPITAVSLSTFVATKMDEISLNISDSVCIYNQLRDGWAEGHNLTQDTFGFFPTKNIKTANITNYQPLTSEQVELKRFRDSDTDSEAAKCAFNLGHQSHLDLDSRVTNIIDEMKKEVCSFLQQLQYLIQTIIEPLLSKSWFAQCHHGLMYSIIEIYNFHYSLMNGLNGITNWFQIGELLVGYSTDFKEAYSKYVSLLPRAVTMSGIEMNEFLRSRIEFCSSDSALFLKFLSLLHGPFQRRKDIFTSIRKVLQLIPVGHPYHQNVLNCWKSFRLTTLVLNELLNRSESQEELYTVEAQLVDYQGPPLYDFGLILLKAPFIVKYSRRKRDRFVYLLEKCIIILKGKRSFLGNEKLSHFAIKSNSAQEIYLDKIILLDKEHFRAVASWELHDKNAFRVIYVDKDGSTRFVEFSAVSRNESLKWIEEIRAISDSNNATGAISLNMPSKRTSSLISKFSDGSNIMEKTPNTIAAKPAPVQAPAADAFPTPERATPLKSVSRTPNNPKSYLSTASVGTEFKVGDIKLDTIPSPASQVAQGKSEQKSIVMSRRKDFIPTHSQSPIETLTQDGTNASITRYESPEKINYVDSFSGPPNFSFGQDLYTFEDEDAFELGKTSTGPMYAKLEDRSDHLSKTHIDKFFDLEVSPSVSTSEDDQDSFHILARMNSHQGISRKQFGSLYNSLQFKVQEYLELKDRIDRITANINKM